MADILVDLNAKMAAYHPTAETPPLVIQTGMVQHSYMARAFDATNEYELHYKFLLNRYPGAGLTVELDWVADTATSGNVTWQVAFVAYTPDVDTGAVGDASWGAWTSTTQSHGGSDAKRLHRATISVPQSALTSAADGDLLFMKISRDNSDTMSGDAHLVHCLVFWGASPS